MKTSLFAALGGGLALGIALIGSAPAAIAQAASDQPAGGDQPHRGGGRGFDTIDANHDGVVTLDEWKAAGRNPDRFAEIDADHDGKITRDEMHAFMEKMRAEHQQNGGGQNDGH
jgi:hypothetical protein